MGYGSDSLRKTQRESTGALLQLSCDRGSNLAWWATMSRSGSVIRFGHFKARLRKLPLVHVMCGEPVALVVGDTAV